MLTMLTVACAASLTTNPRSLADAGARLACTRRCALLLPPMVAAALPRSAAAETIRDVAIRLEKTLRVEGSNGDAYWKENAPKVSVTGASITLVRFQLSAAPEADVEYVWIRKVLPKAPDVVSVVAVGKIKSGTTPYFEALLPEGQYRAALQSSSHGFWEGGDFKIGS